MDVVRVLAAVLLLGNVQFVDTKKTSKSHQNTETSVSAASECELNAVATLLGVPAQSLFKGITLRTRNNRTQLVKLPTDAAMVRILRSRLQPLVQWHSYRYEGHSRSNDYF